jgi:hypothetical protein
MRKLLASLKHGAVRALPAIAAGAAAAAASPSFRHYVDAHPAIAAALPILVAMIHALDRARKPA